MATRLASVHVLAPRVGVRPSEVSDAPALSRAEVLRKLLRQHRRQQAMLVAAVLVLLSANDRAEELQQDIAEQLAALKADAERRRQRESARADLRRVK